MLVVESRTRVEGVTGGDVIELLLDCTDERYQAWWPGVHRELHALHRSGRTDHVGDVVLMDEMVGPRHLRLSAAMHEHVRTEFARLGRLLRS